MGSATATSETGGWATVAAGAVTTWGTTDELAEDSTGRLGSLVFCLVATRLAGTVVAVESETDTGSINDAEAAVTETASEEVRADAIATEIAVAFGSDVVFFLLFLEALVLALGRAVCCSLSTVGAWV